MKTPPRVTARARSPSTARASSWTTGQLDVGYAGTGSLTISNGASVTTTFSNTQEYIGGPTSSSGNGTVTVTGASSKWTITLGSSLNVLVGDTGPGYLYITSGGTVNITRGGLIVGGDNGSNPNAAAGTLIIDGAGSTLTGVSGFSVGYQGAGTLKITNGATESFSSVTIGGPGSNASAAGTATIDGSGTQLTVSTLKVGSVGNGTLHITNGATVANAAGSTFVGSGSGTGLLDFGASNGGTLNTQSLYAAPSQLTGTGTVNATGLVTDGTLAFNPSTGLSQTLSWTNGSGTVTVNLNMSTPANNGALGVGYAGTGLLNISGETVTSSTGFLGYKSGSSGTAVVSGSSAGWTVGSGGTMTVGSSGTGALYICGGSAVTAPSVAINSTSLLEIDAGPNSSLAVGGGAGTLTNNGTVRVVAGADATAGNPYAPISATWAGSGAVQAVGGTWNSGTFTPSSVVTGTPGVALNMDTSVAQRALWTDGNGNSLGASFLAAATSNPISVTATALGGSPEPTLAFNQFVNGDWGLSGLTASSSNPVYVSLSANNPIYSNYTLWYSSNGGSSWSQVTNTNAVDLTFDGSYYSFGLTGSAGNGLDFGGYDYAVVGTPTLAGDVNLDGRVDINDLTIVLTNYSQAGKTWTQGSIDGDPSGTVDINDLTIVLATYNTSVSASAGARHRRRARTGDPAAAGRRPGRPAGLRLAEAEVNRRE